MNTYISPLSSLLLLLLLSTVTTAHDTPVTTPSVAKRRHAMGMRAVRDGVAIARLSDVSNSAQLLAFAGGALKTSDPRAARNYYLEAMRLAASMPLATPNNERVSVQDSVVAGIAELDPLYAMELFRQIDKPDWTAHPEFDMRSRTAAVIARVLFAKTGISKTDDLISLLSYAGDTGQYPYRAADQVISILEQRRQTSRINRMFSDALRHLEDDDTFVSSPAEFSDLLLAHAKVLPNSLCVRAVRAAVDSAKRLDRKYAEGLGQSQRTMIFTSENLQLKVKSQATYVSLRLLPLASRLDSRLADELRHNDPDLHAATSGLSADKLAELANGRGNVMIGSPDPKSSVQV